MRAICVVTVLAVILLRVSAEGEDKCGDRVCVDEVAECINNTCTCKEGYSVGDGDIGCYKDSFVGAEIKNDPSITDFNRMTVNFPLPCRYLASHMKTQLKMKVDGERIQVGWCEVQLHPWHKKHKGKFFVEGLDVAIKVDFYDDSVEDIRATLRVYGDASGGSYNFTQDGSSSAYLPDGQPLAGETVSINRDGVKIEFVENNKFQQVLKVQACGLIFSFRPFDDQLGKDQVYVPGVSIGSNCAYKPAFLSLDKVMVLPPVSFGGTTYSSLPGDSLTRNEKAFLRALTAGADVVQSQPEANSECAQSIMIMDECGDSQEDAVGTCYWLMEEPKFTRCYDKSDNGEGILNLFNECIAAICQEECEAFSDFFIEKATQAKCTGVDGSSTLSTWLSGNGCK